MKSGGLGDGDETGDLIAPDAQALSDLARATSSVPVFENLDDIAHGETPSCHMPTPLEKSGQSMALMIYRAPWVAPFFEKRVALLAEKNQRKWLHSLRRGWRYCLRKTAKSGSIPGEATTLPTRSNLPV